MKIGMKRKRKSGEVNSTVGLCEACPDAAQSRTLR